MGPRKFPPYSIEVEAIQARSMEIYHKIYFPDDSDEAFEVDAMTRASDLCKNISVRLDLEATDGFSLFVAISDKVFSIPEDYFFYDFLSELMNWMRASKPSWGSEYFNNQKIRLNKLKTLFTNILRHSIKYIINNLNRNIEANTDNTLGLKHAEKFKGKDSRKN